MTELHLILKSKSNEILLKYLTEKDNPRYIAKNLSIEMPLNLF